MASERAADSENGQADDGLFSVERLLKISGDVLMYRLSCERSRAVEEPFDYETVKGMRELAELMVWADRYDLRLWDIFAEQSVLSNVVKILYATQSRAVILQVIQTISIMVQSVGKTASLQRLFHGGSINELLAFQFDFSDEEVLLYVLSICKTIALRMSTSLTPCFFDAETSSFPLYTVPLPFLHHPDTIVRTAVRNVALHLFETSDPGLINYFTTHVLDDGQTLPRKLCLSLSRYRKAGNLAEFESFLEFVDEVATVNPKGIAPVLAEEFATQFVRPLLNSLLRIADVSIERRRRGQPAWTSLLTLLTTVIRSVESPILGQVLAKGLCTKNDLADITPLAVIKDLASGSEESHALTALQTIIKWPIMKLEDLEDANCLFSPKASLPQASSDLKTTASYDLRMTYLVDYESMMWTQDPKEEETAERLRERSSMEEICTEHILMFVFYSAECRSPLLLRAGEQILSAVSRRVTNIEPSLAIINQLVDLLLDRLEECVSNRKFNVEAAKRIFDGFTEAPSDTGTWERVTKRMRRNPLQAFRESDAHAIVSLLRARCELLQEDFKVARDEIDDVLVESGSADVVARQMSVLLRMLR